MADITIRFRHNPKSGQRELIVHYESEDDAMPHEHERDHRAWVETLIGRTLDDDEDIIIERLGKEPIVAPSPSAQAQGVKKDIKST